MFRRTKNESPTTVATEPKGPGAKGRPTPTRKEAEAAAKARARTTLDKKAAAKVQRERRAATSAKMREGMRTGDERYLPKRDQGPVKRFVRDFVDARLSIAEFMLPLLILIMVMQYSSSDQLIRIGSSLMSVTLLVVVLDSSWLLFRVKRALRAEFPDESLKGVNFYALMRVLQLRWLRMPKPQVKIGGAPR